jgi:predicted ATP-dependent serine protease
VVFGQSSVIHGLGGIGKTHIALEYAYHHALDDKAVFWIAAETEEQMNLRLHRIAEVLQLDERRDQDQQHVVVAIHRWVSV